MSDQSSPHGETAASRDRQLMARAQAGEPAAITALYDLHARLLLGIGARILRDVREAEDVLHDVFVEVWQKARDYDPGRGSVQAWLCLRMRSRALDRLRSVRRVRPVGSEAALGAEHRIMNHDQLSEAPDRRAAVEALGHLPAEQREVLNLAYFQGLSSSEIAALLGVPVGTVKSRTAAALSKLRKLLGAGEGEARVRAL